MATTSPPLELRTPRLTAADAIALARERFGIEGLAEELGSHQEQNFLIRAPHRPHVLKVANPALAGEELDLQNRAMEHVAATLPGLVPVALRARDGGEIVDAAILGSAYRARLLTYLEGESLRAFGHLAPGVLRAVGRLAGRVASALADFEHPGAERGLQWDLRRAGEVVAALAPRIGDPGRRALAERVMARAAATLAMVGPGLREQVVHGDVTDYNVLARRDDAGRARPCGLIDFGDAGRSWRVAECAVMAATVAARTPARVLQDAVDLVRGFHAEAPLASEEVAALPALMAARGAVSATSCEHQAALEPGNAYAAACVEEAWERLAALAAVPPALAEAAFREACDLPPGPAVTAVSRRGGPVVEGLDARRSVRVDLSATSDQLAFGAWRDSAALAAAVDQGPEVVPVGRHGEARLVHDAGPGEPEPATVHLGADLFLPAQTTVLAPLAGEVVAREERALLLLTDDGLTLRLAGIASGRAVGDRVEPGEPVGAVAAPGPGARLPAHLHVQLAAARVEALPGLAPASLASAWLALCPDPGPLLGLEAAVAAPDPPAVLARRKRFVASPQLLYYPSQPPQMERGWREWLYDAHGRPYLDAINNVAILGHSHPRVEAAAARQLRRLNTNSRFLYDAMGRFAERLAGLVPDPLEVVFLLSSGSEANDLALRLAREVTGRDDVICHEGTYHGWTAATIETERTRLDDPHRDARRVHAIPRPVGGPDAAARSLRHLRELVARRAPAAFVCEPVLGNEGGVVLAPGHLRAAYATVRAAGGLCIADEVQVGYGRLGHHFWAFEQQEVVPDIVTLAKATGNGHPVAAVITTRAIADAFARHDDLFASVGGGPVSCEVGLAVLDALEEEGLQANAREVGDHLARRLAPLVEGHPLVGALHGMGLYRGLELRAGRDPRLGALAVCERLRERGVIVQPTGPRGDVLKLKPPLCVTRDDVELLAGTLEATLAEGW